MVVGSLVVGSFVGLRVGLNVGLRVVGLEVVVGFCVAGFDVGLRVVGSDVVKPKLFGDLRTYNPCPIPLTTILPEGKYG